MLFQETEKEFMINPTLSTDFVPAPHTYVLNFFAEKIANGGKRCPVALPQSIKIFCCFCSDV